MVAMPLDFRVDARLIQHFLTLISSAEHQPIPKAFIGHLGIFHDLLMSLSGDKLDNHRQKVLVDCGYWMLCHLYKQEIKLDPTLILVRLQMLLLQGEEHVPSTTTLCVRLDRKD